MTPGGRDHPPRVASAGLQPPTGGGRADRSIYPDRISSALLNTPRPTQSGGRGEAAPVEPGHGAAGAQPQRHSPVTQATETMVDTT